MGRMRDGSALGGRILSVRALCSPHGDVRAEPARAGGDRPLPSRRSRPLRLYRQHLPVAHGRRPLRRPCPPPECHPRGVLGRHRRRPAFDPRHGSPRGDRGHGPPRYRPGRPPGPRADPVGAPRYRPGDRDGPPPCPRVGGLGPDLLHPRLHPHRAGGAGALIGTRPAGQEIGSWVTAAQGDRTRQALGRRSDVDDVPDPYGGPLAGYRATASQLDELTGQLAALIWPEPDR